MVRTLKGRGLVLLAAVPLLGAAPAAHADGPGPSAHKGHEGSASEPAPRPRTHAKPRAVVLHTKSPEKPVIPGHTYEWTFTITAKGPKKSGKAVFRTTLPKSLAFVSGEKHCEPAGRKVVCHLGTVKKGHKATGVIRAKVSKRAKPGETISPRGTVTWGKAHTTRKFPAVRVARTAGLALSKPAPATARR